MIKSMTGFGSKEATILPFGKICVELRSTNHKFLEIVLHSPEGFLSLEEKIKKEIEAQIKRGRVTVAINITNAQTPSVFINKRLLKSYISTLKDIKDQFRIQDGVNLATLIHLPGVLSLAENIIPKARIWPHLEILVNQALEGLVQMRQKEGRAIHYYLKIRLEALRNDIGIIKTRFQRVVKEKIAKIKTDEERSSFLKDTDITEELERLTFHVRNFAQKFLKRDPIGKELDFIAQEMQREANTMGAKCCDTIVSGRVVQIKSQIEKIREQLQNIE